MGDKIESKRVAKEAGVNIIPGAFLIKCFVNILYVDLDCLY